MASHKLSFQCTVHFCLVVIYIFEPFDWPDLTSIIILIQCTRSSMSRVDVPALLSPTLLQQTESRLAGYLHSEFSIRHASFVFDIQSPALDMGVSYFMKVSYFTFKVQHSICEFSTFMRVLCFTLEKRHSIFSLTHFMRILLSSFFRMSDLAFEVGTFIYIINIVYRSIQRIGWCKCGTTQHSAEVSLAR